MTSESAPLRGPLRKRESHLWERDPQDWYVEPEWCSARLFAVENFEGMIWDPSCGTGRITVSGRAAGHRVMQSDIANRGVDFQLGFQLDFLTTDERCDNIVSNPPFGIAAKFVAHALDLAERKVAMLLPAKWIQGEKRARWLATTPLRRIWFLCPRPSMPPGAAIRAGEKPGGGTVDFAWFVWERGYTGCPEIGWLHRDAA